MYIETELTPNPASVKFLPQRDVSPVLSYDLRSRDEAAISPLARRLFEIEGVAEVFLGDQFLTVTKAADAEWMILRPIILQGIMDHYISGQPVITSGAQAASDADDETYEGEAAEIVAQIKELIELRVRPSVANDGGDIIFRRFDIDTGVVTLTMRGACSGCPSSSVTLKSGIENMLKHYVPEVTAVVAA